MAPSSKYGASASKSAKHNVHDHPYVDVNEHSSGQWEVVVHYQHDSKVVLVCEESLGLFNIHREPRKSVVWIVEMPWFDRVLLLLIVSNSLMMACKNYRNPEAEPLASIVAFAAAAEPYFTLAFALECILKVIAFGLWRKPGTYLRDPWNWLDLLVVLAGIIAEIPVLANALGVTGLAFLRVLRVLRPLRSLKADPELKMLVNTVLQSIPKLGNVAAMCLFLFIVFGILGITFWGGVLHRHCRKTEKPFLSEVDGQRCWDWPLVDEARLCGGSYMCQEGNFCGNAYIEDPDEKLRPVFEGDLPPPDAGGPPNGTPWCPGSKYFNYSEDFNWGITHFDHLPAAFLVLFQCITLEGWVDIMYMIEDSFADWFASIYFLVLLFVGNFFLLNLALAVIWSSFSSLHEEQVAEMERIKEERARLRNLRKMKTQGNVIPEESQNTGTAWQETKLEDFQQPPLSPPKLEKSETFNSNVTTDEVEDKGFIPACMNIANSDSFQNFIMLFIIANVVTMMLSSYPPPPPVVRDAVQVCSFLFNFAFLSEMILMHLAYGLKRYWTNPVFVFDGVIVIVSVVEIFVKGGAVVSALRGFRLLRIFKLAKKWTSFRVLLKAMFHTVCSMGNFTILLFLCMYTFTLMGMEFFGGSFRFDEDGYYAELCPEGDKVSCVPRAHFDTFLWAFVTIFQILSGENWNAVMYDSMRATGWVAVLFFIALVLLGQCIIFNLFLAILMEHFQEASNDIKQAEHQRHHGHSHEHEVENIERKSIVALERMKDQLEGSAHEEAPEPEEETPSIEDVVQDEARISDGPEPQNHIRKLCWKIIHTSEFDQIVLVCIILSSIGMAVTHPLQDPRSPLSKVLNVVDVTFCLLFAAEMLIKHIALGVFFGKHAYWRQGWNILDGIVVLVSLYDLLSANTDLLKHIRTLRVVRGLRPLRVISRNPNLKLVVNTLLVSVPALCNLLVVGILFFLIFGLLALRYLKGSFFDCYVPGSMDVMVIPENTSDVIPLCIEAGGVVTPRGSGEACVSNVFWQRPSPDTPICLGYCDPFGNDPLPAGCPRELTMNELPSFCHDSITWPSGQPSAAWVAQQQHFPMPCTFTLESQIAVNDTQPIQGCHERFCAEIEPDDEDEAQCEKECLVHPYMCMQSCNPEIGMTIYTSPTCKECQRQCVAACRCRRFCEPLILDGGLCAELGGLWLHSLNQHFDNIAFSMLSLFEISTTEGWVDVMYLATDARGPYETPQIDRNEPMTLLFVSFIFVGNFFIINLCVGVIVDNFSLQKDSEVDKGGSLLLTDTQRQWVEAHTYLLNRRAFFGLTNLQELPERRRQMFFFVSGNRFDQFITSCICLNTVTMGLKVFPSPSEEYEFTLYVLNLGFAAIFTCEAVLKLYVFRFEYFSDGWNMFDFCCVIATLTGILIDLFSTVKLGGVGSAIRLFRIARLFRLIRFAEGLNRIFTAFVLSIPKLMNVAAVLFLLLFVYATIGVHVFGKIQSLDFHNDHANFRNFYRACSTLIRSMTGEAWNEIMHELKHGPQYFGGARHEPCVIDMEIDSSNYDLIESKCLIEHPIQCGSPIPAITFFCSYTGVITFVILNLVVAVILEGFEDASERDTEQVVHKCIDIWKRFDPDCCLMISWEEALTFIQAVHDEVVPLHNGEAATADPDDSAFKASFSVKQAKFLRLHVLPDDRVHFVHALVAALRLTVSNDEFDSMKEILQIERKEHKNFQKLESRLLKRLGSLHIPRVHEDVDEDIADDADHVQHAHNSHPSPQLAREVSAVRVQRLFRNQRESMRRRRQRGEQGAASGGTDVSNGSDTGHFNSIVRPLLAPPTPQPRLM